MFSAQEASNGLRTGFGASGTIRRTRRRPGRARAPTPGWGGYLEPEGSAVSDG